MRPSPPLQLDASTIVGSLPRLRIQATRPLPAAEQEPDIGVPLGTKPSGRVHERDTPGRDGLQRTVGDGSGEGGYSLFYPFGKFWDTATKSSLTTTLPISNCRSVALLSAATGLLPAYAYWLNDCGLTAENGRTANAFYSLADVLGGHSAESATWSNLEGNVAGLCKQ